jgi:hypothetical protein
MESLRCLLLSARDHSAPSNRSAFQLDPALVGLRTAGLARVGISLHAMDVQLYLLLRDEVERQAKIALTAYDDMQAALRPENYFRFWYAAQTFLSAAANVSKLLRTPASEDAAVERTALRRELRVADDSPLFNRELRNHFEHFDSRIIAFARENPGGSADRYFGRPEDFGDYAHHALRGFDPQKQQFWFRGRPFPLRPWVEALRDVHAVAQEKRLY